MAILHSFLLATLLAAAVSTVSGEGCQAPQVTFGTTHSGGDTQVFAATDIIQYTCNFGHYPVGSTTRVCLGDGTWTGSDDICRIDVASLSLACIGGLAAILIFFILSCWIVTRKKRAQRRAERRLTIQRENEKQRADGGLNGPAEIHEATYNSRKSQIAERSDSGLQTDIDNDETNLNDFVLIEDENTIDSPTDNRSAYTSDFPASVDDIEG